MIVFSKIQETYPDQLSYTKPIYHALQFPSRLFQTANISLNDFCHKSKADVFDTNE